MDPSTTHPPGEGRRLPFLDFIRFAAMVLMVQGHTLDALVHPSALDPSNGFWGLWHDLRGLTAPMFLLLSGAVTMLGVRRDAEGRVEPGRLLRRAGWGLGILVLGYLLVFPANRIADLRWLSPDVWRGFLQVNILQLNGLTLLILVGLLAITRSDRGFATLSVALGTIAILATPWGLGIQWFRFLPEALGAYLSRDHGSLFPVFPYSGYMFLGVGLGYLLRQGDLADRARRFRRVCAGSGCAALAAALLLGWIPETVMRVRDQWEAGPYHLLFRLGFALLLFALLSFLAQHRPRLAEATAPLGRRSLHAYIGHLVLLYGMPWTTGLAQGRFQSLTLTGGLLSVALVGSLTFGAVALLDLLHRRAAPVVVVLRLSTAGFLAWALIF